MRQEGPPRFSLDADAMLMVFPASRTVGNNFFFINQSPTLLYFVIVTENEQRKFHFPK
jgi:hypothetical protein